MAETKKPGNKTILAIIAALGITGAGSVLIDLETGEVTRADVAPMSCERATEIVNGILTVREVRDLSAQEEAAYVVYKACPQPLIAKAVDPFEPFRQIYADAPREKRGQIIRQCAESIGGNTVKNKNKCREALR